MIVSDYTHAVCPDILLWLVCGQELGWFQDRHASEWMQNEQV